MAGRILEQIATKKVILRRLGDRDAAQRQFEKLVEATRRQPPDRPRGLRPPS